MNDIEIKISEYVDRAFKLADDFKVTSDQYAKQVEDLSDKDNKINGSDKEDIVRSAGKYQLMNGATGYELIKGPFSTKAEYIKSFYRMNQSQKTSLLKMINENAIQDTYDYFMDPLKIKFKILHNYENKSIDLDVFMESLN